MSFGLPQGLKTLPYNRGYTQNPFITKTNDTVIQRPVSNLPGNLSTIQFDFQQPPLANHTTLLLSMMKMLFKALLPDTDKKASQSSLNASDRPGRISRRVGTLTQKALKGRLKGETTESGDSLPFTKGLPIKIDGGGSSKARVINHSDKPMRIAFARNLNAGEVNPGPKLYTVPPGETLEASLPENWAGRIWKHTGNVDEPATLAELTFENGKTWYDASIIDGYNGPMTMGETQNKGEGAGSKKELLDYAPDSMITTTSTGHKVLISTDPNPQGTSDNLEAVGFYNQHYGKNNGYIIPTDDKTAMRHSNTNDMMINFW